MRHHSYKTAGQTLAIERVERRKYGNNKRKRSSWDSDDEYDDEDYGSELDEVEEESPSLHVVESATVKEQLAQCDESYYEYSPT